MKKLMTIVSATVLATMAVGADCEAGKCNYAYRLKMAGKTVAAKTAAASACETSTCWAKPASLRVAGYVYGMTEDNDCKCDCLDWTSGSSCHFWTANKKQTFGDVDSFNFDMIELLRNGGAKDKCQITFKIGDIRFAGFGHIDPATKKLISAWGFFAGTVPSVGCASSCDCTEDTAAIAYDFCSGEEIESVASIAFGRWSLTYKQDKVDIINKTGKIDCLYPTGFVSIDED